MARRTDWKAIHAELPALERRLARALRKSVARMRQRCSVVDLANAIAAGDVQRALAIMSRVAPEDAVAPAGAVVRTAFARGGRAASVSVPERFEL